MYEEYGTHYKKYHETYGSTMTVCLMVGSFYELYDIRDTDTGKTLYNIKEVTDHLGIQLTTKRDDVGPGKEGLFAGFPDYTLHKHAARLTAMGWTVVVVDQVRDKSGKILRREVARILSPATHVEALGVAETPYLTALYRSATAFGLATLDLSTGTTTTYQGTQTNDILQHMSVFSPKELLVYSAEGCTETDVRKQYAIPASIPVHVRTIGSLGTFSSLEASAEYLRALYSIQSMLPPREYLCLNASVSVNTNTRHAELALLFLLQFTEEHMPSAVKRLQRNQPWIPEQTVVCGGFALTQLQMTGPHCVVDLFSSCLTPMGKRDIRNRLLRPRRDAATIRQRLAEVAAAAATPAATRASLERYLRYMGDLPRLHRRCLIATLTPPEFVVLGQSYSALDAMNRECFLTGAFQPPSDLQDMLETYRATFLQHVSMDKALKASDDVTPWNAETYPAVGALEAQICDVLKDLEALRTSLCKGTGLSPEAIRLEGREKEPFGLRASTTTLKALRICGLPKGASIQALKAGGWIETPTLTTLNGRLVRLREALLQQSRITHLEACRALSDAGSTVWTALEEWASHVDCTYAIARTSVERGFVCPEVEDEQEGQDAYVDLVKLRHPLVEATGTRVPYVHHDVRLDAEVGGWLVYGMNASGKSTLMKAIGIAVLLAQAGCYVPAVRMRLRPFRAVYTRILNHDNLFAGLSSFAVEMTELRDILRSADANTLVLGDELCAGTESVSAMSLVAAGIQWLSARNAKYIFATHLHDLPRLLDPPALRLRIWHLQVEYDAATHRLVYHRALVPGSGSSLYGLEVARAMDLPLAFLEQAQANRRLLQGAVTQQEAPPSAWNRGIYKRSCEVCGATATLETHHIQPRAEAESGRLRDGTPVHAPSNLVVLCAKCHDRHHAGDVEVASLVMTSEGPERVATPSVVAKQPPTLKHGLSEEETATVYSMLSEYKTASLKALSYQLKEQHGIQLSTQALTAMRKRGL